MRTEGTTDLQQRALDELRNGQSDLDGLALRVGTTKAHARRALNVLASRGVVDELPDSGLWRRAMRVIPISKLTEELPPDEALSAVSIAMEEFALAKALIIIHGQERGTQRYVEAGGRVRIDADDEPVLLWRGEDRG